LGGALGYLMPESQKYTDSGATAAGSNVLNTLVNAGGSTVSGVIDAAKKLPVVGGAISGATDYLKNLTGSGTTSSSPSSTSTTDYLQNMMEYGIKDGGMVTLMADGGEAQAPSYYTFGQVINPQDILNQMAQGGEARQGGLHVPTVEGRHDYREGSRVTGQGDGQSDDIPAMLADGEYVFDADTVAQLGNGSTKAGSDLLDKFREEIRAHKRSAPVNKIPPPAKSPLAYMKAAQSRSNKNG
jgi:hypothetical protein